MSKEPRNIAASVRQKLKNQAIQGKWPFAEVAIGIKAFLQPIASALSAGEQFTQKWLISGSWV